MPCMLALRERYGFRYGVMKDDLREKRSKSSKKPGKTKVDQQEELETIFNNLRRNMKANFLDHS